MAASGKKAPFVRPVLWLYAIGGTLILVALVATVVWLGPLPPKIVVMSTGAPGSDFDVYAQQYQTILRRSGVELRMLPSSGSVDNLRRLDDPLSGVNVAFVQSGLTSAAGSPALASLGTVFYEPFWFFVRREISATRLDDLRDKKLAIGPQGSGTRVLAKQFLALNGLRRPSGSDRHQGSRAVTEERLHGEFTENREGNSACPHRQPTSPRLRDVSN